MTRMLIVSNRLPIVVKVGRERVEVTPSAGGLATGMRGPHERLGGLWLGWPGEIGETDEAQRADIERQLLEHRTVPIYLSTDEVARFYEGFSNATVWPLFHYLLDRVKYDEDNWETYRQVNARFADEIARRYEPGDLIWIHDYQLLLLPRLLRERIPKAAIGFFLHIPFPASEVFRILPWREEILRGLLGADLIGFHATTYLQHFASSTLRLLGLETRVDRVEVDERQVRLGVFPMGVDSARLDERSRDADVLEELLTIRRDSNGQRLLLAVDRLDYTKGILMRLRAIERLFESEPTLRGTVRFVQVAVPSRTRINAYEDFRRSVEEAVGHINGRFGTTAWMPVHYLYRSVDEAQLLGLYRAADVALVTPLRDGMNLVAKEFVAARSDEDGVLVLSEFAGAAEELDGAVLVNPYDTTGFARAIRGALDQGEADRGVRMRLLRGRVLNHDVHRWADDFVKALTDRANARDVGPAETSSPEQVSALVRTLLAAEDLRLLLDYDGTLAPFASTPDRAAPDAELRALLTALSTRPKTRVCIVSGRTRASLERWLGDGALSLAAEHGFWTRFEPGAPWQAASAISTEWKEHVRPILVEFTDRTPGSSVEEKGGSMAWHFRRADPEFGAHQANELHVYLGAVVSSLPVEILRVDKVLEVRSRGLDKGHVTRDWLAFAGAGSRALAMGNDRTDEDMFVALGSEGLAVHVGPGASIAAWRVPDPNAARKILWSLVR